MKSQKWFGVNLEWAIKVAYAQNVPPENLVIFTSARLDSVEDMLKEYGPKDNELYRWTAEEAAYAARVWEEGKIIQPRLHAHAVYEIDGFSSRLVGYEPGEARNFIRDPHAYFSGSSFSLYGDISQIISNKADYQLVKILQEANELPEFKDANIEQNAEALRYVYTMSKTDITLRYETDREASAAEIHVPEGVTSVVVDYVPMEANRIVEDIKVIHLSKTVDSVKNWNPNAIIVCADEEQRDLLNKKSYLNGIYMSPDEYASFLECSHSVDKAAWIRERDPEPLYFSDDGTQFKGVKWYYSNLEEITLPSTIESFDIDVLINRPENNLRRIVCENPDIKFSLPYEFRLPDEQVSRVDVIIGDSEPRNIIDVIKSQNVSTYIIRDGWAEDIHPLYKNDEVLVIPEGVAAVVKGLENTHYSTIYLPSTFKRLSGEFFEDSVQTIVLDERINKIDVYGGNFVRREEPITIVCSESARKDILRQCYEYWQTEPRLTVDRFKIHILSLAEFTAAKEADSLNGQYPVLGEIDSSGKLAKFVNENALCYEEVDGVAKISFENGSGIIISNDTLVTYEISNGNEIAVDAADIKDMSTDKLLEVLESVEKTGAKETSLDVERDNIHDNDEGFSLND